MKYDIRQTSYMALPGLKPGIEFKLRFDPYSIMECVSSTIGITLDQMKSKKRKREFVESRQIAMWLMKKYTRMSLKMIGSFFHSRDHTTVIHSINTCNDLIDTSEPFKQQLLLIENKLGK